MPSAVRKTTISPRLRRLAAAAALSRCLASAVPATTADLVPAVFFGDCTPCAVLDS
ncbi:hypothetical protein [Streptomyces ardesiacus]|uniref:hypothetical protein n=1 Tax=Streptomyces ardesiacus TaxID=285564 RepID=UPI002FDBE9FD